MPRGVIREKRQRRSFTDDFGAKAVQLVRSSGKSVTAVATVLDLTFSSLRNWVTQAEVDAGGGKADALTCDEKSELSQLRKENRALKEEREILKKAAVRSTGRRNTIPPGNWMKITVLHDESKTKSLCRRTSRALALVERRRVGERHRASAGADAGHRTRHALRLGRHRTYGSPRVPRELRADGERTSRKRVARPLRERGLSGRP